MGNNCCRGKEAPTKAPAFVSRKSSIQDSATRFPQVWYEPTETVKEISASLREQQRILDAQQGQNELDTEEYEQMARVQEWREQQNHNIKKHQELAAKAEFAPVGAKLSDEEARIAEARRIVAEADAAIALRMKELEESDRISQAKALADAEEIQANNRRKALFQKKQEDDSKNTIDQLLNEARMKVEALLS